MNQDTLVSSEKQAALKALADANRISQNAADRMDEAFAGMLGISRSEARCLDIAHRMGRVSAGDLGWQAGLTSGAVTALVDRMEAAGYLRRVRDTGDRRRVWIEPTARVLALAEAVYGPIGRIGARNMANLPLVQIDLFTRFLRTGAWINAALASGLRARIEAEESEDPMATAQAFASWLETNLDRLEAGILSAWTGEDGG